MNSFTFASASEESHRKSVTMSSTFFNKSAFIEVTESCGCLEGPGTGLISFICIPTGSALTAASSPSPVSFGISSSVSGSSSSNPLESGLYSGCHFRICLFKVLNSLYISLHSGHSNGTPASQLVFSPCAYLKCDRNTLTQRGISLLQCDIGHRVPSKQTCGVHNEIMICDHLGKGDLFLALSAIT